MTLVVSQWDWTYDTLDLYAAKVENNAHGFHSLNNVLISNVYILAVIPTTTAVSIREYITTNERWRGYSSYQSQQSTEGKSSGLWTYR